MGKKKTRRGGGKGGGAAAAATAAADAPPPPPAEEGTVAFHKGQGNAHFAAQQFAEAVQEYERALGVMQDGVVASVAAAGASTATAAAAAAEDATKRSERKKIFSNLSAALLAQGAGEGRAEAALQAAESCVAEDDEWPKGWFRKGQALQALARLEEARDSFKEGLRRQRELPDAPAGGGEMQQALEAVEGELQEQILKREADEEGPDRDKFDSLVSWLRDSGAEFPKLYMKRYDENYRGVHCLRNIPANECILRIPQQCLITVEMGHATEIGSILRTEGNLNLSATKHCYLCIFVLVDRLNEDSFFQPYYRILPDSYDNMPIFWSQEQLAWLEGSYVLQQIRDRKENIRQDYRDICELAPAFSQFSLSEFQWARMMVASRNFGVTIDGQKTDALVPYADMLNHLRPRQTKWTFEDGEDDKCFTITSLTDLDMGAQVFDSYGKKCNSRFLLNYGFAVENNRDPDGKCHNEVRLFAEIAADDSQDFHIKCNLLGDDPLGKGFRISMTYDDTNTKEAFSWLRFIHASGTELIALPTATDDDELDFSKNTIEPLSTRTEILVLETLAELCRDQLMQYPTTLEEDNERMQGLPEFSNERNCVIVVRGEKEVCQYYIDLAERAVPLLQGMPWKDVKRLVNQEYRNPPKTSPEATFSKYMTTVVAALVKKQASQPTHPHSVPAPLPAAASGGRR